jgi:cytochrome c551/c552
LLIPSVAWAGEALPDEVRAIFERKCVSCHQSPEAKGGLDLTTAAGLRTGGESGEAVTAGDAEASVLMQYVVGDEPLMPKNGDPLTAEELAALEKWIAAGAAWPDDVTLSDKKFEGAAWWSTTKLSRPDVPEADAAWVRTPIDAFIWAKQREHGLHPAPEADRRTLIRRLSYDLLGLPPTPDEVDAFVNDAAPDAYERLVDRLLASPHYGERWARHWLDVVHYGDTHGYDKDKTRPNAWPYRDYVIRAFNGDKPYAQFVREQLAGDVLFPDSPDGIVATGFIAAGPFDYVGQIEVGEDIIDKKITRNLDRDDMVATAINTFVSTTAQCARCHNHKFDPIPQEDYYSLQAVFAGIDRADRPYPGDAKSAARRAELVAAEKRLKAEQDGLIGEIAKLTSAELQGIEVRIAALTGEAAKETLGGDAPNRTNGYHSNIETAQDVVKWVQIDLGASKPIEQIYLFPAHVAYGGHPGPGFGFPHRFRVEVSDDASFQTSQTLADETSADVAASGNTPWLIAAPSAVSARYVRVTAEKLWERTNDFIVAISELAVISGGENIAQGATVTALDSIEAPGGWGRSYLVDGLFAETSFAQAEASGGWEHIAKVAGAAAELRDLQRQAMAIREQLVPEVMRSREAAITVELEAVAAELATLPDQPLVYAAATDFNAEGNFRPTKGKPRPIHLLARGSEAAPQQEVAPGALSCVSELPSRFALDDANNEGSRRAALAEWIVDANNPLTWRSIANRMWLYHFGRGLVDTPNDFGRMGTLPTHPELLDWLAVEFRDGGQSLKSLHRLIVTSAVYRQSSAHDEAAAAIDAGNQYLWRMNRRRLEAEAVYDAALVVAGKLDTTMYGPGFQAFAFRDDHSPEYKYHEHDPDDPKSHRRSIYRFIVRSVPDPFMETLDCADPSLIVEKRNETLTPLQVLAQLNNKFMVRMAEHFAARASASSTDPREQMRTVFKLAIGRDADEQELNELTAYAQEYGLPNACRAIMNLNEFVFVD